MFDICEAQKKSDDEECAEYDDPQGFFCHNRVLEKIFHESERDFEMKSQKNLLNMI